MLPWLQDVARLFGLHLALEPDPVRAPDFPLGPVPAPCPGLGQLRGRGAKGRISAACTYGSGSGSVMGQ